MPTVWKQEFCHEIILLRSSHKREKSSGPSQADGPNTKLCSQQVPVPMCVFMDSPWPPPWKAGSPPTVYGVWHGRWTWRRAEGPWSSSYVPPCCPDPGDGPEPAALGAEPSTSEPGGPRNSACTCRGQADLGQNPPKRKERTVEQVRLN